MSLRADQKDYKAAYLKHWSTYQKYRASGSKSSQRLLLAYSVECGLKYILMKREKIYQVSNAQDEIQSLLKTHDFRKLLKRLMLVKFYTFPIIKTIHNEVVQPEQYHELCRYSSQPKDNDDTSIEEFEEMLVNISEWIGEQL